MENYPERSKLPVLSISEVAEALQGMPDHDASVVLDALESVARNRYAVEILNSSVGGGIEGFEVFRKTQDGSRSH